MIQCSFFQTLDVLAHEDDCPTSSLHSTHLHVLHGILTIGGGLRLASLATLPCSASYGAPCSVEPWGSSPVRWSFRSLGVTSNPPVPWRRPRVVVLGRGAPTYHIGGLLRGFPHAMTDGSARASPIEAGKAICHVHDFEAAAIRTMRYPGRTCTSPAPIGPHRHEAP